MPNQQNVMEVYFDEAGFTGENLNDPNQSNLLFAAVAIPGEVADKFWNRVRAAWELAGSRLNVPPDQVELKGSDLYGGKGQFIGLDGSTRLEILDAIFSAMLEFQVRVFWDGLAKHQLQSSASRIGNASGQFPFWRSSLFAFCDGLYQLLSALHPNEQFHIAGDENSWIKADRLMEMTNSNRWRQLAGGGIEFYRSSESHGLQVADVVVHTLYRANRAQIPPPGTIAPRLSNTDRTAKDFHARLAAANLWINVSTSLVRIDDRLST
jgi:hypothetical protein